MDVVLTDHFVEATKRQHNMFDPTAFWLVIPKLEKLGEQHVGQECMVILKRAKLVFTVQNYRLVLITCMPRQYEHNAFQKAKTVFLGEIEPRPKDRLL